MSTSKESTGDDNAESVEQPDTTADQPATSDGQPDTTADQSDTSDDSATAPPRRWRPVVIAVLALALVAATAFGWRQFSGNGEPDASPDTTTAAPTPSSDPSATDATSDPEPSASGSEEPSTASADPSPTPSVDAGPEGVPAETEPEPAAQELVPALVEGSAELMGGTAIDLSQIASESMIGELQAQSGEAEQQGWVQVGVPTVVSIEVTESRLDDDPPAFDIAVCLDSSGVQLMQGDTSITDPNAPTRSLSLYTVQQQDDRWVIASHSFPDNPDC